MTSSRMELSRDRMGYDSAVSTALVLPDSGTVVQFRTHDPKVAVSTLVRSAFI